MSLGPNIKRATVWAVTFFAAQGMIYRWGWDEGFQRGHQQGYTDVDQEARCKEMSREFEREDLANSTAASLDRGEPSGHAAAGR